MAAIQDLEPCWYLPFDDISNLLAVGWLERKMPFSTGDVTEVFFEKLCQLLHNHWEPRAMPQAVGLHHCDLCRFTIWGEAIFREKRIPAQGKGHLYIPGNGVIYVSPVVIAHYMDAHNYRPPDAFIEAVMNCPEMRSVAYYKMILANGGRSLTV